MRRPRLISATILGMSDPDEMDEADVTMEVIGKGETIVLTFKRRDPFTVSSFLVEVETYLHEYSKALEALEDPTVKKH